MGPTKVRLLDPRPSGDFPQKMQQSLASRKSHPSAGRSQRQQAQRSGKRSLLPSPGSRGHIQAAVNVVDSKAMLRVDMGLSVGAKLWY